MNQRNKQRELFIKELTRFFDQESYGLAGESSKRSRDEFQEGLGKLSDSILHNMVLGIRAAKKERGANFIRPSDGEQHKQNLVTNHLNSQRVESTLSTISQVESKRPESATPDTRLGSSPNQLAVFVTTEIEEVIVDDTTDKKDQPLSIKKLMELLSTLVILISEKFANMYFDFLKQMIGIQNIVPSEAPPYTARSDYRSTYGVLSTMLPQSFSFLEMRPFPVAQPSANLTTQKVEPKLAPSTKTSIIQPAAQAIQPPSMKCR